ncbi:hypothetical protein SAMD00019534_076770 [Acytostelium subglobosum LB1]|uniref:hypothetical protein n=1 Tax=Acytostelium subglobosum LB1 TaxID=1410327 RepID=UPI000644CC82|nr:hypothetical protein SAMD00019534_076770 [Acytostelium subglobosum LB1]GAM24502.1 hypothetical protein SAMD00019534_076770 [Acytostelium subglobosum LB1]|eukprot:XP_012752828.1 hypothetical protein SAMD00019534_076770 [Acytostelium subglobosum LB1]
MRSDYLRKMIFSSLLIRGKKQYANYKATSYRYDDIDCVAWMCVNGHFALLADKLSNNRPLSFNRRAVKHLCKRSGCFQLFVTVAQRYFNILADTPDTFDYLCASGRLHFLIYFRQMLKERNHSLRCSSKAVRKAATNGHLDLLEYLHKHNIGKWTFEAKDAAALSGNLGVVRLFHERRRERYTKQTFLNACTAGQVDVMTYLLKRCQKNMVDFYYQEFVATVKGGHVEALRLLMTLKPKVFTLLKQDLMQIASGSGHVGVLELILEDDANQCTCTSLVTATKAGQWHVVDFLIPRRCVCFSTHAFIDDAAAQGRLDYVKQFNTMPQYSYVYRAMELAAQNNHEDVIRFLALNRTEPYNSIVLAHIAARGTVSLMEFMSKHSRAPFTFSELNHAASAGNLPNVIYLCNNRTEGCSIMAMTMAASNGHLDVVEYLHKNRTEGTSVMGLNLAASHGHLDVVKFLHYNRTEGCGTYAMDNASLNGYVEIVKFLHYNRTEGCTTNAMNMASVEGHLEVVSFLHLNRTEGATKVAMNAAAINGHRRVVEFLHNNRTEGFGSRTFRSVLLKCRISVAEYLLDNGIVTSDEPIDHQDIKTLKAMNDPSTLLFLKHRFPSHYKRLRRSKVMQVILGK